MEATTLTLTRRAGEKIRVGPDVLVEVAQVNGGRVRLRITAPHSTRIIRDELPPQPAATPAK